MEKKNYLKPDFALNNIKTTSFIAASVETGEGGISCTDQLSETVIEAIFYVNTGQIYYGDGEFEIGYFKNYLKKVGFANIKCGYINEADVKRNGIGIEKKNKNTYLTIGNMSFEKEACYTATLENDICIRFTRSEFGTNCNNYNFIIPK